MQTSPANLWDSFAGPLRAFVAKRIPPTADVDDVVQDVFVRIQEQLPHLRDADRIDAWIFQIARNVVANVFRTRSRRDARNVSEDEAPELLAAADDDEREAVQALASCLTRMIDQLPEPYRTAIELTEIAGLTQAEAAERLDISLSGMKSRVQRGRARLEGIIRSTCRVELDVRGGVTECDPLRPSRC
jgi:RNA polymerase sigma-70 factor, ECF subfamily